MLRLCFYMRSEDGCVLARTVVQCGMKVRSWIATVVATMMIAQQIASKAIRDGFFLTEFDVTVLPTAVVAAAVVSFASAFLFSRFIGSFSPFSAVPILFAVHGSLFVVESVVALAFPQVVAGVLFLHTAAFGGAVVSGFWSIVNESFDPYAARQVMGRIAGGATLGGVLGGGMTWLFAELPISTLLGCLGVANWICGIALLRIPRHARERAKRQSKEGNTTRLLGGVAVLAKESYPRLIGLLVFLGAAMTALIDYVFKVGVSEHQQSLVGFFAIFYTAAGVVTFVLQSVGSKRILRWAGVVPTILAFPLVAFVGLVSALLFPFIGTLVALRGGTMVVENSLYRSGYELLYTPIPRQQKRSAKILIDLGCDRIGTAVGSGVVMVLIAASLTAANQILLVFALIIALLAAGVLVRLRREYMSSLETTDPRIYSSVDTFQHSSNELTAGLRTPLLGISTTNWQGDTTESRQSSSSVEAGTSIRS